MKEKESLVSGMTDSEFLSFLFAERERENSLSQYQGWNNWALAGALITLVYTVYSIWKNEVFMSWDIILYSAGGMMSFYFVFRTFFTLFRRERGYDYYRVRILGEEIPWVDLILIFFCAVTEIVCLFTIGEINLVFWLWGTILMLHIFAVVCGVVYKHKVLPPFYENVCFPNLKLNVAFNALAGGIFGAILSKSFKVVCPDIFSSEFEVGVCCAAGLILVSVLLRINAGNRVVKKFDAIIDRYIYAGVSKEDTYQKILCNRMGYGVLESCRKEILSIRDTLDFFDQNEAKFDEIIENINNDNYEVSQLQGYLKFTDDALGRFEKGLDVSTSLAGRLNDIMKIAPDYDDIQEVSYIVDLNKKLYSNIRVILNKVQDIIALIMREKDKYYCRKFGGLCEYKCEHRNDPKSVLYVLKWRLRKVIIKS